MYRFYFDESFHDRKIVLNKSGINTCTENNIDSYIGFFWGAKADVADKVIFKFEELDKRLKKRLGLIGEFKATTFNKKNFRYGIRSFNNDCFTFYCELFDLLDFKNIFFQYDVISKIELLLTNILSLKLKTNIFTALKNGYSLEIFIYSLSKFIYTYQNKELIEKLYNVKNEKSAVDFMQYLIYQLIEVSKKIEHIERKKVEFLAFQQMIIIIKNLNLKISNDKTFNFDYTPNFYGLRNLLEEVSIDPKMVSLYIDNERNTFESAKNWGFKDIKNVDSLTNSGVRISDFLSNFVGRFIYAITNDENMKEDKVQYFKDIYTNNLVTKRLLSDEWFDLSKEQYELYYKIAKVLIINHQQYWAVMTGNYFDNAVLFAELLKFFYYCGSFERYCKMGRGLIKEYYNSQVCRALQELYEKRLVKI